MITITVSSVFLAVWPTSKIQKGQKVRMKIKLQIRKTCGQDVRICSSAIIREKVMKPQSKHDIIKRHRRMFEVSIQSVDVVR